MKQTFWLGILMPFLLAGCFNRPATETSSVPLKAFGVKPGRAKVVVFSALWCHPCREEIGSLNQAMAEFGSQVDFVGFLVEGEQKGSVVEEADRERFTSFKGEKPNYEMKLDRNWALFDQTPKSNGRALPTMILIDRQGLAQGVIQQSIDYNSQLRPRLVALASGEAPPPIEESPTEPVPAPGAQVVTESVEKWLVRSEVAARSELATNLKAAWEKGLEEFGLTSKDMPLGSGQITFVVEANGANIPKSAVWFQDTPVKVCKVQLVLAADGSLVSKSGYCRPK